MIVAFAAYPNTVTKYFADSIHKFNPTSQISLDVLGIEESDVYALLSFDRAAFDFFITTKDEIVQKKEATSIYEGLSTEITHLTELFFELFNKINVATSVSRQLKNTFVKKTIELFKLFIESGFSNKHMIHAFVAYMYFNLSRHNAMFNPELEPISLREQDRSKWDTDLINQGL